MFESLHKNADLDNFSVNAKNADIFKFSFYNDFRVVFSFVEHRVFYLLL